MEMTATALEARSLYRFFHAGDDEVLALRGVSLCVAAGEIVAIVGPSGSGKSTLLACLSGLDEPDGGQVRVSDQVMTRRSERARAALRARSIGVLLQSDNLVGHLDVGANIAAVQRLGGRTDAAHRSHLLERLGLTDRGHALPAQLSGGEAVRAGLAVALANQPSVLIADEPTGELDSDSEQRILELVRAEAANGCAIALATHSDSVAAVADRIVELVDGVVVA
jgi:putative ABC transport system ATP-binding protein